MAGRHGVPKIRIIGIVAVAAMLGGCYTMRPTGRVVPGAGTRMAFDVTDAGRVALGPTMGPEITRIEGRLVGAEESEYLIAVSTVRLMRGGTQVWRGEQVRVRSEHVASSYIRSFDKTRSIVLGAGIAASVAAVFITRSLLGSGDDNPDNPGGGGEVRIVAPQSPFWRLNFRGAFP